MKHSIIASLFVLAVSAQAHATPISSIGTWHDGTWYLDMDHTFSWTAADEIHYLGMAGDQPYVMGLARCAAPGTTAKIGSVRNENRWFLSTNNLDWDNTSDPGNSFWFGSHPMKVATWNGVPIAYGDGNFYVDWNGNHVWDGNNGDATLPFGRAGMIPLVGVWNTNGTERIGAYDPSNNMWFVDSNNSNALESSDRRYHFGWNTSDIPVVIWYTETFSSRIGIFNAGNWYIDTNGNGTWDGVAGGDSQWQFGNPGDIPVVVPYNLSWRSGGCFL